MTCPACGAQVVLGQRTCNACSFILPPQEQPHEIRRNVVVLFTDLVGSTSLGELMDPEALRQILDSYFTVCAACISEHGGVVEKFIGDAVMAVFGVPAGHDDDAVRAIRAAVGIHSAINDLNSQLTTSHGVSLSLRSGIYSGETLVIFNSDSDFRVVGDAVNTASRLQSAANSGEILLGADVAQMARHDAQVEQVAPLSLKGKSGSVPAWRVIGLNSTREGVAITPSTPLVNRQEELGQLRQAYLRAKTRRQPCLVTLLGEPGIGKTRLVRDFVSSVDAGDAAVTVGRCRSYGRGSTYQPVAEILYAVQERWPGAVSELDTQAVQALESLLSVAAPATGASDGIGVEEISRAVYCLFEKIAQRQPLIVVWDDLQWAEPNLLDLIDDLTDWLTDTPVLMICLARSELLERRPSWGGGKLSVTTFELGPLTDEQVASLVLAYPISGEVSAHEGDEVCERVIATCEGNPLFAELMLDVLSDGAPRSTIPPTISALVGARLDQLAPYERGLLERAAVAGRDFSMEQLRVLLPPEDGFTGEINDLVSRLQRRRFIHRDRVPGTFRFTQVVMRDVAYSLCSKSSRERWHLRIADWASGKSRDDQPDIHFESTVGYHLEAAYSLRRALRPGDSQLSQLGQRAARELAAEGLLALHRRDLPAAAGLLVRAQSLLPAGHPDHRFLAMRIADTWLGLWDARRAHDALAAAERASPNDPRTYLACEAERGILAIRMQLEPIAAIEASAERIANTLEADPDDDLSWCRLGQLQAYLHVSSERLGTAEQVLRTALARAQALSDGYEQERVLSDICQLALWGPTPVGTGLRFCAELLERFAGNRASAVPVITTRAGLLALAGDIEGARDCLDTARHIRTELHLDRAAAVVAQTAGIVERLADDHAAAVAEFAAGATSLRQAGQIRGAQTLEAYAARELFEDGHLAEALSQLETLEAQASSTDTRTQLIIGSLRGCFMARTGRLADAVAHLRKTAQLAQATDDPCLHADVLVDLSRVLWSAGQTTESNAASAAALDLFSAKGAHLQAQRAAERKSDRSEAADKRRRWPS